MLKELKSVRQIKDEPRRRWFSDETFDLIVFADEEGNFVGFHLCYGKEMDERILVYDKSNGLHHGIIDSGENCAGSLKSTPVVIADKGFEKFDVINDFKSSAANIEQNVREYVFKVLGLYTEKANQSLLDNA